MTPKQRKFTNEYLQCFNASEAARRAGYSERGIRVAGSRLLANDNIKAEIDRALLASSMLAAEVLKHLATIGRDPDHKQQLRALELIGKHHGLFEMRLHIESVQVDVEKLSNSQLQAIARGEDYKNY